MKLRNALLILLAATALAACGNKGPLVLPDGVHSSHLLTKFRVNRYSRF